jgi:hypothetical protein
MGDWVYQIRNGKTHIGMKPMRGNGEPTEAQLAQHERFKEAAKYGKRALRNSALRPAYMAAAKEMGKPAFALAVKDFFNAPTIESLDVAGYNGQPGQTIRFQASDDFGVVNAEVVIRDEYAIVENGSAVEDPEYPGQWNYVSTARVDHGAALLVSVTVTDRPGGEATQTAEVTAG